VGNSFMADPTEVMEQYLAEQLDRDLDAVRHHLRRGRISMGLEVISLVKLIEDHSILASKEETISVLKMFLVNQGLDDVCHRWYERLDEWRKPKFRLVHGGDAPSPDAENEAAVRASFVEVRPGVWLRRGSTDAPPCSDQTTDPPSVD